MNIRLVETFKIHGQTEEYEKKIDEVRIIIKQTLKQFEKPYIAFSGGKDSTVLLKLVLEKNPEIMVHHWMYHFNMLEQIEKEIEKNAK